MILPLPEERAAWVDVLEAMYDLQFERERPVPANGGSDDVFAVGLRTDSIAEETGVDREAVPEALRALRDLGLAAGDVSEDTLEDVGLTANGVAMAHRVKTERQQRRTNQHLLTVAVLLLLVLTAGIVL